MFWILVRRCAAVAPPQMCAIIILGLACLGEPSLRRMTTAEDKSAFPTSGIGFRKTPQRPTLIESRFLVTLPRDVLARLRFVI